MACWAFVIGGLALNPARVPRSRVHIGTPPLAHRSVNVHMADPDAIPGFADAVFGITFFGLFASSGILFIKSTFYESQDEGSIMEDDPFRAVGQRLPFSKGRLTEEQALTRAEELSAQLRLAISQREYPEALALKRELAELMVDYRLDYEMDDDPEVPPGTVSLPDDDSSPSPE